MFSDNNQLTASQVIYGTGPEDDEPERQPDLTYKPPDYMKIIVSS